MSCCNIWLVNHPNGSCAMTAGAPAQAMSGPRKSLLVLLLIKLNSLALQAAGWSIPGRMQWLLLGADGICTVTWPTLILWPNVGPTGISASAFGACATKGSTEASSTARRAAVDSSGIICDA
jgi:hypothetical protein